MYGGEGDRWTGYTHNRPYGLTERLDESKPASRFEDEGAYRSSQRSADRPRPERKRRGGQESDRDARDRDALDREAMKDAALFREDARIADEWFGLGPEERERESRTSQRLGFRERGRSGDSHQERKSDARFRDGVRSRSER